MKHTICFIDDKIPVAQYFDDTDIISGMVIQFLLKNKETEWDDQIVKGLCERLLSDTKNWSVSAFTSPAFYDNYTQENVYSPEILIYDWDYSWVMGSNESEEYLLRILQNSYTMIFIFSEDDNIEEIQQIVQKPAFLDFGNRLNVINKGEKQSIDSIFLKIEENESQNFSFRYGHEIIYKSNTIMNKVLSEISLLSVEDFVSSIGSCDGNKYISTNENFVDAIFPRYKSILRNYSPMQELSIKKTKDPDLDNVRKIWAYRLYDQAPNNHVQMGDVVIDDKGSYFLVVSSDCHMLDFWKKNFGYIALVPMFKVGTEEAKKRIQFIGKKSSISLSSLTSNKQSSMTILPCIPYGNDELVDFVVIPKSVLSVEVNRPEEQINPLLYEHFEGYTKVTSISDPFKSPLIQFVFDNISGYGCPDFPNILKENINNIIKQMQQ